MRIVNVYTKKEDRGLSYTYRFEFKNIPYKMYPSLMLHYANHRIIGSMLCNLHEYNSLRKVNPYENIRS